MLYSLVFIWHSLHNLLYFKDCDLYTKWIFCIFIRHWKFNLLAMQFEYKQFFIIYNVNCNIC